MPASVPTATEKIKIAHMGQYHITSWVPRRVLERVAVGGVFSNSQWSVFSMEDVLFLSLCLHRLLILLPRVQFIVCLFFKIRKLILNRRGTSVRILKSNPKAVN